METEDRESEGRTEAQLSGNVVPFPRDWFGPPEELVPFGARTDRSPRHAASAPPGPGQPSGPPVAGEASQPDDQASQPDGRPQTGPALRPEDFWEGAAIQEVIAAPVDPAPVPEAIERRPARAGLPGAAARALSVARALVASRPALVVMCAVAGIGVVLLGSGGSTRSLPRRSATKHQTTGNSRPFETALLPFSLPRDLIPPPRAHRRVHSARGVKKPSEPPSRAVRSAAVATNYASASSTPVVAGSPVSESAPPPASTAAPAEAATDEQSQTAAQGTAAQTPAQQNTSAGSSNASSSAGSSSNPSSGGSDNTGSSSAAAPAQAPAQTSSATNQPARAFGQGGILGPGSSPNG